MRVFAITADITMGLILGVFLHTVGSRLWSGLQHPAVAVLIIAASVLLVLFRRPNGTLARRREDRSGT